jgi:hypothetical protein
LRRNNPHTPGERAYMLEEKKKEMGDIGRY